MYSFGFICLGEPEPRAFTPEEFAFQVKAEHGVASGRGDSSQLWPLFQLLSGCTYELGHWHNPNYFSAWDVLHREDRDGPGQRSRVRVRPEHLEDADRLLGFLIDRSPQKSVLVFVDVQGIPETFRIMGPMTREAFWRQHGTKGLISGWLYKVTGESTSPSC